AYIIRRAVFALPPVDRNRIFSALLLIALSTLFWAMLEQSGSTLTLFTERFVDRRLFGWNVATPLFQSVNPILIVALSPLVIMIWSALAKRQIEPSAPFKFGIGLLLLGAAFLVLVSGATMTGSPKIPVAFILALYCLFAIGELCFSPVGLSAMTRLSIPSMTGLMIGTWFLANAAGNFLAGSIAQMIGSRATSANDYTLYFGMIACFAFVSGIVLLIVSPLLRKLSAGLT
ncbi:MAG: MFS transporter, partial [Proteobacteria bacterium]